MSRDDQSNAGKIADNPELAAVAGELRALGAAQTALAETLVVDLASSALAHGMAPSVLTRLQSFDRLAQEVDELATVLDRLSAGIPVDEAFRVRLGDLCDRLSSRLNGPGATKPRTTERAATVELF